MAKYTLTYANARGRAEVDRLVLAAGGQEFEDKRIDFAKDWPALKPSTPLGILPTLEVTENGKTYTVCQSVSIARFLAKRFGLYGKDDVEQVHADMYADQISDLVIEFAKLYFEKDEAKKKELDDKFYNETIPNNFKYFDKRLVENKGHFLASGLSYTDLYLYAWLEWLGEKRDSILESYPAIKALVNEIKNHPRIAAYLAKRPVTER